MATPEAFNLYFRQIQSVPMLTYEDEKAYGERVQASLRAGSFDYDAADRLINSHLRYVVAIARKYRKFGVPLPELVSEGNEGLFRAVEKFDPKRDIRFSTYATRWIQGYIREYILHSASLVKITASTGVKKTFFGLSRVETSLGIDPEQSAAPDTIQKVAEKLGVHSAVVTQIKLRRGGDSSLNLPLNKHNDPDGATLLDVLPDERPTPEGIIIEHDKKAKQLGLLKMAMSTLTAREHHIFTERRLQDEPTTLELLARHHGVSRERVRQIDEEAFEKVQHIIKSAVRDAKTEMHKPKPRARPASRATKAKAEKSGIFAVG